MITLESFRDSLLRGEIDLRFFLDRLQLELESPQGLEVFCGDFEKQRKALSELNTVIDNKTYLDWERENLGPTVILSCIGDDDAS